MTKTADSHARAKEVYAALVNSKINRQIRKTYQNFNTTVSQGEVQTHTAARSSVTLLDNADTPAQCGSHPLYEECKLKGRCPYRDANLLTVGVYPLGGLTWCGPFTV